MAKIEFENWMPMAPNQGPPLPRSMGIYWPWYKPVAPPEAPIYACPYCTAEFPTEPELLAHIRDAHAGQPPQVIYVCPYCGARFYSSGELNQHMATVHPAAPPPLPPPPVYACPYCTAEFASEAELNYHIETMHPAAPPPPVYACPHCGAQFATEAELSDHIEAVHPPAPPPPPALETVTVRLKNPPSGATIWVLGVQSHDEAHNISAPYVAIDEPITLQMPASWFPLYSSIAVFSAPLTKPIYEITNRPSLSWFAGYDASLPLITDYGSYYYNVATRRFEKV